MKLDLSILLKREQGGRGVHICGHARCYLHCVTLSTEPPVRSSASQNARKNEPMWTHLFLAPHTGHGTITGVAGHKTRQMRHETHIFEVSRF